MYNLVNGDYGEHDIASGKFSRDVEKIIDTRIDTSELPEAASRTKIANAFVNYLKSSKS